MLCEARQGMCVQEGFALCHWPAREYQATCRSGQQVNARASRGRNAQIESQGPLALLHDTFDDTHAMLLNLAQKYGFAEACCQAAHGGESKVNQARALYVGLRKVVDARSEDIAAGVGLLRPPAIFQRFFLTLGGALFLFFCARPG